MKTLRAIIIDDEPRGQTSLQKLLQFNCPEVEVIGTSSHADDAVKKIITDNPDLIFLDIAMPGKNGFEMLNSFSEISFEIIFVTAHNNFLIQALRLSAIDYLLKPVDDDLLKTAVMKATQKIQGKKGNQNIEVLLNNLNHQNGSQKIKICIPSLKGFQVFEIKEIVFCEANGNYTNFYLLNKKSICASKPLHEYEELLSDCGFIRTHKSFLVNIEHIKEYIRGEGGSVILSNGQEVEVSRRKKDLLIAKMKEYYKY